MGIGAAQTKGAHAGSALPTGSGPSAGLGDDVKGAALQGDVRVCLLKVQGRGELPMLEGKDGLDE